MNSGIYGIKNIFDGKWYIGQSSKCHERKIYHFWKLRIGKHYNNHLQFSFKKYGESAFEFHVLEECPEVMLDVRERSWIQYYHSTDDKFGYNLQTGGCVGKHHSEESRKKMSELAKARLNNPAWRNMLSEKLRNLSPESREKVANWHRGRKRSKETCIKIGLSKKGHVCSPETRKKISVALEGRFHSEEAKQKMRVIQQQLRTPERNQRFSERMLRYYAEKREQRQRLTA